MDDANEPPAFSSPVFGHFSDPGQVEGSVRGDLETEVSVGITHGDPSALLKRGVGHMDGPPSIAHRTTQGMGTQAGYLGIHDDHLDGNQGSFPEDDKNSEFQTAAEELATSTPHEKAPHKELPIHANIKQGGVSLTRASKISRLSL